jgi:hypothetical protein
MSPNPELTVIAALEAGREDFLAAIEGLSDAQAAMRPAEGRWSVLECMEHIVTVEERFQGWIDNGKRLEAANPNPENEAALTARVTDRSFTAQAPEAVQPKGRFASVDVGRAAFQSARDRSVQMAQERGGTLYEVGAEHPRFGPLNGMEVLFLIAGHARRHAAQIRENRAALGH